MSPRTTATVIGCVPAVVLTALTAAPASAAAPSLPNPCHLLTTAEIVGALHPSPTTPTMTHSTYSAGTPYESKTCIWQFGSLRVVVSTYNKVSGSGGAPSKTTPEPSLGPDGKLVQSSSPQYKFTYVSYKRHSHYVEINVNRDEKSKPMLTLGKDAYNRT